MAIIPSTQREAADPNLLYDIYCDESSQTRHRFMVMGGIIIKSNLVEAANRRFLELKLPELPAGELKWGVVSRAKFPAYCRIVDAFFDDPIFSDVEFHSTVVDTWHQDHTKFNDGDRQVTFNKELYQLANKFARLHRDKLFHLYPDDRETTQRPGELRDILNFGRRKKNDSRPYPYRRSHFRKSHETPMLQVVDILLGAVAYCVNDHIIAPGASVPKTNLARHILSRAGVTNPKIDTNISGKFTIWHRQLEWRKGVPRARSD